MRRLFRPGSPTPSWRASRARQLLPFTPDGPLLVATQFGRLRIVQNGTLLTDSGARPRVGLCTATSAASSASRSTRLSRSNRFVYLYYTRNKGGGLRQPGLALQIRRRDDRDGERVRARRQHPVARTATTTAATSTSARTAISTSASATAAATTPATAAAPAQRRCPRPARPDRQDPAHHARRRHPADQPLPGQRHGALQRHRADDRRATSARRPSPAGCATRSASPSTPTRPARASSSTTSARAPGRRSTWAQAGADYGWNVREGTAPTAHATAARRRPG